MRAGSETYGLLQQYVSEFGYTKLQLSARLKSLGVAQKTTVMWLKHVAFTSSDASVEDLDAAVKADVVAGGRVLYRLLNQYVQGHGFTHVDLKTHLLGIGHSTQQVDMMAREFGSRLPAGAGTCCATTASVCCCTACADRCRTSGPCEKSTTGSCAGTVASPHIFSAAHDIG